MGLWTKANLFSIFTSYSSKMVFPFRPSTELGFPCCLVDILFMIIVEHIMHTAKPCLDSLERSPSEPRVGIVNAYDFKQRMLMIQIM